MFTLEELDDLTADPVLVEYVDETRWTKIERVIFINGQHHFYAVTRVSPLTEYQEVDLSERFPDPAVRVRARMITATVWEEV